MDSSALSEPLFPFLEEEMKEWVESFQGRVFQGPALAIRRCFGHLPFVAYP